MTTQTTNRKPRVIDFRRGGTQIVDLPWAGESRITFAGICPLTHTRLYECDTGNDPRGPLGIHAVHEFVASEYGMIGPSLPVSWIAVNNDRKQYERGLALAKEQWKEAA